MQNAVFLTVQYEEQHPDENDADDEDAEKDHTNWKMDLVWLAGLVDMLVMFLLTFLWLVCLFKKVVYFI